MNNLSSASADVRAVRVDNLRRLIRENGGTTQLSKLLKYSNASYLSQMTSQHPTRGITEVSARKMEAMLGLPVGWMDIPHDRRHSPPSPEHAPLAGVVRAAIDSGDKGAVDVPLLTRCVAGVMAAYASHASSNGTPPGPARVADAITIAYLAGGDDKLISQIARLL